jgi:hypothetical protein
VVSGLKDIMSQNMSQSLRCVTGFLFKMWIKLGNKIASLMKKIGVLFPTKSQIPSSV